MKRFKTLLLTLGLLAALALGALGVSAAEVRPTVYGPFAGSATNADAQAFCADAEFDTGWVRNAARVYGGGFTGQPGHWFFCSDLPD